MTYSLIHGDAIEALKTLPNEFVQTVVTSPPYYGQRLYGDNLEFNEGGTLDDYCEWLSEVFSEVRHKLLSDGVLWLNIGDAYTSGNRRTRAPDKKNKHRGMSVRPATPEGLKPKELIGLPWRVALRLQEDGWYLRSRVIWDKPNAQPESVRDRPTQNLEEVFMLTKSDKYHYNADESVEVGKGGAARRLRSLWSIPTQRGHDGHPAPFPEALVDQCLRLTGKEGSVVMDPFNGSGTTGVAAIRSGMRYVGIDAEKSYLDSTRVRLNQEGP